MLARMQMTVARRRMKAAFDASSKQLGKAVRSLHLSHPSAPRDAVRGLAKDAQVSQHFLDRGLAI
jgi:hypothetical protein